MTPSKLETPLPAFAPLAIGSNPAAPSNSRQRRNREVQQGLQVWEDEGGSVKPRSSESVARARSTIRNRHFCPAGWARLPFLAMMC